MKVSKGIMAIILPIFIFGGIGLSSLIGYWQTESSKVPAVFNSGEFKGEFDPADIRGSYSFGDVKNAFDIPVDILAKAFGIEEKGAEDFQNKELESKYEGLEQEIGTASVRLFVALYKGLPYNLEAEETWLTDTAVEILKERNLTKEQLGYVEKHTIKITNVQTESKSIDTGAEGEEYAIKGKTTFKELLDWGMTRNQIEEIIGGEMPATGIVVRDYCTEKNIEFSPIKTKLQEKLDEIKK